MVTYEITAIVEAKLVESYEDYMRRRHIPQVLASGCFRRAGFTRATRAAAAYATTRRRPPTPSRTSRPVRPRSGRTSLPISPKA